MALTNPSTRLRTMQLCEFADGALEIEESEATWAILTASDEGAHQLVLISATRAGAESALALQGDPDVEYIGVDLTAEPINAFYDIAVVKEHPPVCHSWPTHPPFPRRLPSVH